MCTELGARSAHKNSDGRARAAPPHRGLVVDEQGSSAADAAMAVSAAGAANAAQWAASLAEHGDAHDERAHRGPMRTLSTSEGALVGAAIECDMWRSRSNIPRLRLTSLRSSAELSIVEKSVARFVGIADEFLNGWPRCSADLSIIENVWLAASRGGAHGATAALRSAARRHVTRGDKGTGMRVRGGM